MIPEHKITELSEPIMNAIEDKRSMNKFTLYDYPYLYLSSFL